jgi:hypothetical protein
LQFAQDQPQQHGGQRVQQHVDQMVAHRRVTPEVIFEPERAMRQWVILRRGARIGPEAFEPGEVAQDGIVGDVVVVVPDETVGQGQAVGQQCQQQQGRGQAPRVAGDLCQPVAHATRHPGCGEVWL